MANHSYWSQHCFGVSRELHVKLWCGELRHKSTLNITLFFRFAPEKTQIKSGLWCMCEGGSALTTDKVVKKLNTNCKSGRLILWDQ